MKFLKGYRTLLVNVVTLLLSVFSYLVGAGDLISQAVSNPKHAALTIMGISVINIVLRFFTNTPWGKKVLYGEDPGTDRKV